MPSPTFSVCVSLGNGNTIRLHSKALIAVAAEVDGKGIGRIRLNRIPDALAKSPFGFVRESVVAGSEVHTDGWLGCEPLKANGYRHEATYFSASTAWFR